VKALYSPLLAMCIFAQFTADAHVTIVNQTGLNLIIIMNFSQESKRTINFDRETVEPGRSYTMQESPKMITKLELLRDLGNGGACPARNPSEAERQRQNSLDAALDKAQKLKTADVTITFTAANEFVLSPEKDPEEPTVIAPTVAVQVSNPTPTPAPRRTFATAVRNCFSWCCKK
jgi:hypothetical protein